MHQYWSVRSATMEISQLLSFSEIVKSGSYSKAAKTLFLTQSAVSHQIINLEKELNIKLFERFGKAIKLTEEGLIFSKVVGTFLTDLDNLKRISEDIRHSKTGHLTVAASNPFVVHALPTVIQKFLREFPGVKFKLITRGFTFETLPMVLGGEVDFIFGTMLEKEFHPKIDSLFWKSYAKILLMPKHHPLSRRRSLTLPEIAKYPLIVYRTGSILRTAVEDTFAQNGIPYEIIMELDVAENIKNYVAKGFGLSIISAMNLTPEDKEKLVLIDVSKLFGRVDYGIHYRKDKYLTASMKGFIRFFSKELYQKLSSNLSLSQLNPPFD